jgi:hypothetical protein
MQASSCREFRVLLECRNSPCLPHNAFKKLPPWSGMSRDAYLDSIRRNRGGDGWRKSQSRTTPDIKGWGVTVRSELPSQAIARS